MSKQEINTPMDILHEHLQGYICVFDGVWCPWCGSYDVDVLDVKNTTQSNHEFTVTAKCRNTWNARSTDGGEHPTISFLVYVTSLTHVYVPKYHAHPRTRFDARELSAKVYL